MRKLRDILKLLRVLWPFGARRRALAGAAAGLFDRFAASECLLLEAYCNSIESESAGPECPPDGCSTEGGSIDLGPMLYFLNHPPRILWLPVWVLVHALQVVEGSKLPTSRISQLLWCAIVEQTDKQGIVAGDGTIYGESEYEQLDLRWLYAVVGFVLHVVDRAPLGGPIDTIPLRGTTAHPDRVTIAIIGDWGTGRYGNDDGGPAQQVIDAVKQLNPDYIIHLGDVYYAGTSDEEAQNLLGLWPDDWAGKSFTLNSNHEMYNGAYGYFDVALAESGPFRAQRALKSGTKTPTRSSFFALDFDPWLILGLDSAYDATVESMYMTGALGEAQRKWVNELCARRDRRHVIVMTHHDGLETDGSGPNKPLWDDVVSAVGSGGPGYWYWGHVHNGIAYAARSPAGEASGAPGIDGINARCAGHGAIPFGRGSSLLEGDTDEPIDGVSYVANTPVGGGSIRRRNGFATLTLDATNRSVSERFYEVYSGAKPPFEPVWCAVDGVPSACGDGSDTD